MNQTCLVLVAGVLFLVIFQCFTYPQQRITLVILQNATRNAQEQNLLQEELQDKFGYLERNEERRRLEDAYLKENYSLIFEQEKSYNFAKPVIEFFEHPCK